MNPKDVLRYLSLPHPHHLPCTPESVSLRRFMHGCMVGSSTASKERPFSHWKVLNTKNGLRKEFEASSVGSQQWRQGGRRAVGERVGLGAVLKSTRRCCLYGSCRACRRQVSALVDVVAVPRGKTCNWLPRCTGWRQGAVFRWAWRVDQHLAGVVEGLAVSRFSPQSKFGAPITFHVASRTSQPLCEGISFSRGPSGGRQKSIYFHIIHIIYIFSQKNRFPRIATKNMCTCREKVT